MNKTSPTAAGPTKSGVGTAKQQAAQHKTHSEQHVDAINQVFALFRVNFHNQYYSALSDSQLLSQTKKLWADSLSRFTPDTILKAAKRVIEESEYLPTLHKMIEFCRGDNQQYGLPDVRQAFIEACQAPSPKSNYAWSHPAVYFAGKDCDWFFLSSNTEQQTFPVFKDSYRRWCDKVKAGEKLPSIELKQLTNSSAAPLDKAANKKHLQELRKQLQV